MTDYREFKKELMRDWGFRWRWYWYSPKYWLISLSLRILYKLTMGDDCKEAEDLRAKIARSNAVGMGLIEDES